MDKRILRQGDQIEVQTEDGNYDWGTFLAFSFGESDGHLMYERPPIIIDEKMREEIRFVPIDWIKEIKRVDE